MSYRHSILIAIIGFKTATDTVINATNMSFLEAKTSGLVAIMATSFLYVDDRQRLFSHTLCSSRKPY